MKSFLTTVGSVAVLLASASALPTTNLPRQDGSCFIQLKNGDGDASVGASIPANTLFATANNRQVDAGVNAQTVTSGCVCQAFSDAAGTIKLGGIFDDHTLASFTDASSGSVDSQLDQAVPIGSFCCVTTPNTVTVCSGSGTGAPPPPTQTVRVQINSADDSARQIEVPADGSPFAASFSIANSVEIVHIEGSSHATCQAFSDANGVVAVGSPFGIDEVSLNGGAAISILSIRCKLSA
ncbi:hypothetical protein N5P37_011172 [Trichoderma harzianum]|uniref:Uncharacterized protein n=1 Tax=Trichoderma harzianum CBS 226.95 TaxID=983964 RepID=A0A2T3ZW10_TRIHA|nr:hypothetical protein M431DRAFT_98505 [Trichoderma harzianum CBS 226.95]KAK0756257.1 hypothetical protein N5P37_011172 [Trichoderma harzianum]PKK54263.1 hypothetical protein CI102_1730 [Trichoderma harzianum]PTB48997.1 hypothetical protein M431DRAFT_98505 [Trichoderma harzianum CBS 226.95]